MRVLGSGNNCGIRDSYYAGAISEGSNQDAGSNNDYDDKTHRFT